MATKTTRIERKTYPGPKPFWGGPRPIITIEKRKR